MTREKNLIKNTFILLIGTVFPKTITFITLPIITYELSKAHYGTYELINTLMSCLVPVVTLQLQTALFRFLIEVRESELNKSYIISSALSISIPCSFVMLVVFIFVLPIMNNLRIYTRILIFIYFLVDSLTACFLQILRGLGKNRLYSVISIVQSLCNICLIVLFLKFLKLELNGLLISLIISLTISLFLSLIYGEIINYINFANIKKDIIKDLLNYSIPMIPNGLSSWIVSLSDRLIISLFMGIEATAIYAVANKIPSSLNMIQSTFTYAWQENASLVVNESDSSEYFGKIFQNIFDILVSFVAVLISFTPLLFSILIRGNYNKAYNHMIILFLGIFFNVLSSVLGGIYVAYKKSKQVGISTSLAAIINIVINISLIKYIGLYGASFSTVISYLVLFLYRIIDVQKIKKIKFQYLKIIIYTIIIFAMLLICQQRKLFCNVLNIIIAILILIRLNKNHIKKTINKIKISILK